MWTHVGRLWTSGEVYLALDASQLSSWSGFSGEQYEGLCGLSYDVTSIPLGGDTAALIGPDGTVSDESWLEIFRSQDRICIVQASAKAYGALLQAAVDHPLDENDESGATFTVPTGELVLYNAAMDGAGEYSGQIAEEAPGPPPVREPDPTTGEEAAREPMGLRLQVSPAIFQVTVRWFTELEEGVFARWLLTPQESAQPH